MDSRSFTLTVPFTHSPIANRTISPSRGFLPSIVLEESQKPSFSLMTAPTWTILSSGPFDNSEELLFSLGGTVNFHDSVAFFKSFAVFLSEGFWPSIQPLTSRAFPGSFYSFGRTEVPEPSEPFHFGGDAQIDKRLRILSAVGGGLALLVALVVVLLFLLLRKKKKIEAVESDSRMNVSMTTTITEDTEFISEYGLSDAYVDSESNNDYTDLPRDTPVLSHEDGLEFSSGHNPIEESEFDIAEDSEPHHSSSSGWSFLEMQTRRP
jgi:hypothetical protein